MNVAVTPHVLKLFAAVAPVLVVAAVLLPISGAGAAPTWLAPQDLSAAGRNALEPQVSVNQAGDVAAIWQRSDGTNTLAQVATRPAGGGWSTPEKVSVAGADADGPQVGIDASGSVVALWRYLSGGSYRVQASTRPAGGSWSGAQDLSTASTAVFQSPQLAVNAAGDAAAVWSRGAGGVFVTQVATRPAGGAWSAPQDLSPPGQDTGDADVALDPAGDAMAVWYEGPGANYVIKAAYRPAGGAWSASQSISAPLQSAFESRVALDASGNAVAVWERSNGSNSIVQAAPRPAGGAWSVPQDLSAAGQSAAEPQVAVDPVGNAVAVWKRYDGANYITQASSRPAGGTWGVPQNLSVSGEHTYNPQIAVDPNGNAFAVWWRGPGPSPKAQKAIRAPAGGWSAPSDLSAPGQIGTHPAVAADPNGNAVAVWQRFDGANQIVQAAGYDAAGPKLNSLAVPASGSAGAPLGFSVSPLDVWSPVTDVSWILGDGQSASGAAVTHAYSAAGSYAVQVTATDAVGNSSTASGGVLVGAGSGSAADTSAPTVTVKAPKKGKRYGGRAVRRVRGTASDPSGVTKVEYAVQAKVSVKAASGAKKKKKATRCRSLQKSGKLSKPKSCKTIGYLTASGTISWSAKIKKALRKGNYTLYARATDAAGNTSEPVTVGFRVA